MDGSPALDAVDFDWDAFPQGVHPTRRPVCVYARADLVTGMEELAGQHHDDMLAVEKEKIVTEVYRSANSSRRRVGASPLRLGRRAH